MKLDAKTQKELNKTIDGIIKKNGFAMNAKSIDHLSRDFDKYKKHMDTDIKWLRTKTNLNQLLIKTNHSDLRSDHDRLVKRIAILEKTVEKLTKAR